MKNKLSLKIAIAHVCTIAATSSFAYLPDNLNKHQRGYAELSATFMEPSNINYSEQLAGPTGNESNLLKTDYHTGLNVLLGYFLTEQDDLSLNYAYNKLDDSHASFYGAANNYAHYATNYNALDLSLGHTMQKQRWTIHVAGGLDYTHFATQKNINNFNGTDYQFQNQYNVFNGVGPQFGAELGFSVYQNLRLIGGLNVAALMSELRMRGDSNDDKLPFISPGSGNVPSIHTVSFKTQAKLGLSYASTLKNNYPFAVELGYKGTFLQNQIGDPILLGNSFSMNGPYLSVGLSG